MKITKISVYQIDVPIKPATISQPAIISHDRVMSVFDETIVRIETDAGIDGPTVRDGRITAPDGPGIGAVPMLDVIGGPIAIYG